MMVAVPVVATEPVLVTVSSIVSLPSTIVSAEIATRTNKVVLASFTKLSAVYAVHVVLTKYSKLLV